MEALSRNPNSADLLTLALNAALQSGDIAHARNYVEKLAPLWPDDGEIARLYAQLRR